MNRPSLRAMLALSILAIVLAACGTSLGAPASEEPQPSQPAAPSDAPSEQPTPEPTAEPTASPTPEPEAPAEERQVDGILTVAEGLAFSGPGSTIAEALASGASGDSLRLVHGVLLRDLDGTVYLATSVSDPSVPTFDGPILEVRNTETDGPVWDMKNAELFGLEEADGIVFRHDALLLGYLELP